MKESQHGLDCLGEMKCLHTPHFCATCCEGDLRTTAAQCSVPPESAKLAQDVVLQKWRAHVPRKPGDPRRERERAATHVGKHNLEAREAAHLCAHDELGGGFEHLMGHLLV